MLFLLFIAACCYPSTLIASDGEGSWDYFEIDDSRSKWGDYEEPEWMRYFGLAFGDVDGDGLIDVASGRYLYFNPGNAFEFHWERVDLGVNADAMFLCDMDADGQLDILAQALPEVLWLKAEDASGTSWSSKVIAHMPLTGHVNGQGYRMAQLIPGGREEVLMQALGGIRACTLPDPEAIGSEWPFQLIVESESDEGFAIGDVTGDGLPDIVFGTLAEGDEVEHPTQLMVAVNPGTLDRAWNSFPIGRTFHAIDRVQMADLDGDGLLDVVISEERYPGLEPDASLHWFRQPEHPLASDWERHTLITQYSMNNLAVGDVDMDGDADILTAEHKGDDLELHLFRNDGTGQFEHEVIDEGKECHLGFYLIDLDQDGDLDLVATGWDQYQYLHFWRNNHVH